jgi:outer membrane protein assembly factor BamE (lipoprotein component of BamABCDE complex)
MKNTIYIIAIAALLCGCISVGRQINQAKIQDIKPGQTTRAELEQWFGHPSMVMQTDKETVVSWSHIISVARAETYIPIAGAFIGGADAHSEALTVSLNTNGIVTKKTFFTSAVSTGPFASQTISTNAPANLKSPRGQ